MHQLQKWYYRIRGTLKDVLFPLICLQFARTLLFPSAIDIILLFILFLFFLGIVLDFV